MSAKIEKIGRYEIVSELGRGAMGIVYKGYDRGIDRFVAIKTLGRNLVDADDEELENRFRTEAKAAGRLNHPNIISVYEFGEDTERAFIAMEFVEGTTLSDVQKSGTLLDVAEILSIMRQVLDALQYAHERGVVHRDIKPSNIIYTSAGEVKIADFGIARLESSTQTQFGTVLGTPGYMSPEQVMGQRVDQRSDIFSSGVLLYELLTGERAFKSTNITSTTYKIVNTELPPPSKICPTVPEVLDPVIARALAKRPDDRYQSAREFAQAMDGIQVASQAAARGVDRAPDGEKTILQPRTGPLSGAAPVAPAPAGTETPELQVPGDPGAAPVPDQTYDTPQPPLQMAAVDSAPSGTMEESVPPPPPDAMSHGAPSVKRGSPPPGSRSKGIRWILLGVPVLAVAGVLVFFALRHPSPHTASSNAVTTPEAKSTTPAAGSVVRTEERYPPGKIFSDCRQCPTMIVVPQGSYLQGSAGSDSDPDEMPQHRVSIDYPLAVGVKEVTRGQYAAFFQDSGRSAGGCWVYGSTWQKDPKRNWSSPGFLQDDTHPVTCVSWEDAVAYTGWLTKKTGHKYRLLSESEWEYAARAGAREGSGQGMDGSALCRQANVADKSALDRYPSWQVDDCTDGYIYTAPAGSFAANHFGISDMLGNVLEWVTDCWNDSYLGAPSDGSPRVAGDCNERVLRGGSWYSRPMYVRAGYRDHFPADHRSSSFGFRVARELGPG